MNSFGCAGAYAYAFVTIPTPEGSSDGGGIEATFLFKANGSAWVRADRSTECASVPAQIHANACETN